MITLTIGFQQLIYSNEERYCKNASKLSKPPPPCYTETTPKWKRPTFWPNRTTSVWTKSAENRRHYISSSFRSTSSNAPSTSQWTENYLAALERYSPTLTKKASTTTRHGSYLQILVQHQFYQRPLLRAHQQDKYTKHTNCLLQHNVFQHEKKKTKYDKYQALLTALRNLIKINIFEPFL